MRSIAAQSVAELGGSWSVLARQKRDHIALDILLHRLGARSGQRQQEEVLARICRLVFTHAFAEEAVLWPALRRALPDGEELTLRVEAEHQEINELVTRLETTSVHDPDRAQLIDRVVALLRQDVRDEEDVLLPRLQAAVGDKQLRGLGILWELVRRTAPTRAHPMVARRPPGNIVAALPLSALDRARDELDHAARRTPARPASVLRAASHRLGGGARRMERLPLMRTGERPQTTDFEDSDSA